MLVFAPRLGYGSFWAVDRGVAMAAISCGVARVFPWFSVVAAAALLLGTTASLDAQTGTLQSIRNDVREGPPPSPATSSPPPSSSPQPSTNQSSNSGSDDNSTDDSEGVFALLVGGAVLAGAAVTAPVWAPFAITHDDFWRGRSVSISLRRHDLPRRDISLRDPLRRRLRRCLRQPRPDQRPSADQHRIATGVRHPVPTPGRTPCRRRRGSTMERRLQRDHPFRPKRLRTVPHGARIQLAE